MGSDVTSFGVTAGGEGVSLVTLRSGSLSCGILTYGGTVAFLTAPDRAGRIVDVALGFDTLADYERQNKFIGALVGRHANRIGGSVFTLDGKTYPLLANDGANHLHGGRRNFSNRVWTLESAGEDEVALSLFSPDGEEGYPGNLSVRVTYTLRGGALSICYTARSDAKTLCNLTNHSYFNLNGHASGSIAKQEIQLFAENYTPADGASLPVGMLAEVAGTPMDLRQPTRIAAHIDDPFDQLRWAGGYDHNWVVDGEAGTLRPAARASCRESGIRLDVETTLPGIQFYTGNFLEGCPPGKGGAPYGRRWGFCLETQFFPNATNCPAFLQPVLSPGEVYDHTTVFHFSGI